MGDTTSNSEQAPKKSFFKGLKAEFNKIVWPDRDTTIKQTTAVLAVSIALGIVIGILDFIMKMGIDGILLLVK